MIILSDLLKKINGINEDSSIKNLNIIRSIYGERLLPVLKSSIEFENNYLIYCQIFTEPIEKTQIKNFDLVILKLSKSNNYTLGMIIDFYIFYYCENLGLTYQIIKKIDKKIVAYFRYF